MNTAKGRLLNILLVTYGGVWRAALLRWCVQLLSISAVLLDSGHFQRFA